MTTQDKIKVLLLEDEIAKQYAPFDVCVSLKPNYETREPSYNLIFPNVSRKKTREEVSNFLKTFPTNESDLRLTTSHGKYKYEFKYKFDLSSNPNGSDLSLKYIDQLGNEIYMGIPVEWVQEYLTFPLEVVPETQLHYFGGVDRNNIPKIRTARFKSKEIAWYGNNYTLVDNAAAEDLFNYIINTN